MTAVLIAAGGAVGTLARYGLGLWLTRYLGGGFPFATLAVNLLGSFALGIVAQACAGVVVAGAELRLVLGVGVLGGFTTYSSFNLELLQQLARGQVTHAAGYLALTVVGSLMAGALGLALARSGW